jgi:hypothetical protein
MALLLVVQRFGAISPENRDPVSGPRSKTDFAGRMAPKKEARPIGPGTPYALRRNIFRKRQKTMGCFAFG